MTTERLEQILEAEAAGYAAFVTRLPLKQALIRRGQIGPLQQLVAREEAEQRVLRQLEHDRIEESSTIAQGLGLPPQAPLKEILPLLAPQQAMRLQAISERLVDQAKRLQEGNDRCAVLLQASLDFVRYSMEVFGRFLNPEERLADMLYGPAASETSIHRISLLNRSA